jgi:hypothetical protein
MRFRLKGAEIAKFGFGHCTGRQAWEYVSATYLRQCAMFKRADEETISARMEWLSRRKQ